MSHNPHDPRTFFGSNSPVRMVKGPDANQAFLELRQRIEKQVVDPVNKMCNFKDKLSEDGGGEPRPIMKAVATCKKLVIEIDNANTTSVNNSNEIKAAVQEADHNNSYAPRR